MKKSVTKNIDKQKIPVPKTRDNENIYSWMVENLIDGFALQETIADDNGNPVDYRFLDVNPAFEKLLNREKSGIIGQSIKEVIPGLEATLIEKYGEVVRCGKPVRFDHYCPTQEKYFELIAFNPYREQFLLIFRDITEQKRAEIALKKSLQEKELLLREIHHRVKNNLAMVSSLLNIQSSYIKDELAKIAFADSRKRINSIALIHEKLYLSPDLASIEFGQYIYDLTDTLIKSYSIPSELVKVISDIDDIYLNIDISIPLGLIVTELVTNSLKYGFKDDGKLTLSISLKAKNSHLCLTAADNGVGIPADLDWRNTETLGIQLVILLAGQLKGKIQLDRSRGTSFQITFPKPEEPSLKRK